jgi:hypothetical protein
VQQRSVRWVVGVAAIVVAIAIPAVLWQAWSGAATPATTPPKPAVTKRAKKAAANEQAAAKAATKAAPAPARSSAGSTGTVYFDQSGRPLARFAAMSLKDPAPASGLAPGSRAIETTIAMQNLTAAPLELAASMFQVRDANGGLHAPASGGADAAATPAPAGKGAERAKPTKPAKPEANARKAATPRARARPSRANAPVAVSGGRIDLPPGQTRLQTLRFVLPADARVASILVAPDANHLVSLAVLAPQTAPAASPTAPQASAAKTVKPAKSAKPAKSTKAEKSDKAAKAAKPARPRATPKP